MTDKLLEIVLETAACPLCGSGDHDPVLVARSMDNIPGRAFQVARCKQCGLFMTNPRPVPESMSFFYEDGLYEQGEGVMKAAINPVMKLLSSQRLRHVKRFKKRGTILDIGCGKGKFLKAAARDGWETWGVESSQRSLSLSEKGAGVRILNSRFENADLPDDAFDVITMWHTLEHFYEPREILNKAGQKLKNDGVLFVRVPNCHSWDYSLGKEKWFQLDVPRHLYHFSPETLSAFLDHAGFKLLHVSTSSLEDNFMSTLQTVMADAGFPPGSIFRVIKGFGQERGPVKMLKTATVAITAAVLALPSVIITEAAVAAGRGGTITAVAVKKEAA